jgi:hypothetical protein
MFKIHLFSRLPSGFEIVVGIQQDHPDNSIDDIISAIKRDERTRAMRKTGEATSEAHFSQGNFRGRGRGRGRGLERGNQFSSKWCAFCCTSTHNTPECQSKEYGHRGKRTYDEMKFSNSTSKNDASIKCYYCAELGHRIADCPIKKKADSYKEETIKKPKVVAEEGY